MSFVTEVNKESHLSILNDANIFDIRMKSSNEEVCILIPDTNLFIESQLSSPAADIMHRNYVIIVINILYIYIHIKI